ncbi:reverse transcriptase domain-containing protein [Pseudodesulfovibrio methanolicus]|uniref:RNA-directed DNA polymerase n=1 Tax=Pseudodesulfovibrio methanolicus TaxID=3126690 RepID=A0ABZ2IR36_9BACT
MPKATLNDFQSLTGLTDLALFLGFPAKKLSYVLYKHLGGPNGQYTDFEIKKRSGSTRNISAPFTGLKGIQRRLAEKLQDIYMVKKSVHGFVTDRDILSNATNHSRKRFVFNVDLQDFFPSIHFGRVLGLFTARPYEIKREVAILIAKIACHNDILPQGSPCSPVITNMICAYMDKQLSDLSKSCGCFYTRYADDLTFSTNKNIFPEEIAITNGIDWDPGEVLQEIVSRNGFQINDDKTSMRTRSDRQLVTGIVVNDYPNIRRKSLKQVRAMLHDWKVNGLDNAQEKYINNFDLGNRSDPTKEISFPNIVRGKLEHIRHVRSHRIDLLNTLDEQECIRNRIHYNRKDLQSISKDQYYKYLQRYKMLLFRDCGLPTILGEGETDWMHLRKAFSFFKEKGDYSTLDLNIHKHKRYTNGGFDHLNYLCNNANALYVEFQNPIICVYDCDIKSINEKHKGKDYIDWGNNVFSIILPKPAHRTTETFAIEQLYQDADLLKEDKFGRRLFLSTEFHKKGQHKIIPDLTYGMRARDGKKVPGWDKTLKGDEKIIDDAVCTATGGVLTNKALSKRDFAIKIMRGEKPFNKMDYSGFKDTFDRIQTICNI